MDNTLREILHEEFRKRAQELQNVVNEVDRRAAPPLSLADANHASTDREANSLLANLPRKMNEDWANAVQEMQIALKHQN